MAAKTLSLIIAMHSAYGDPCRKDGETDGEDPCAREE